jgi:hypothetical protein
LSLQRISAISTRLLPVILAACALIGVQMGSVTVN